VKALAARFSTCLVLAALCRDASAEPPSRWDRARDPALARADAALDDALATVFSPAGARPMFIDVSDFVRAREFDAAVALELKGGAELPSSDLWYFLGRSLISADRGRDEDGRRILRKALAVDPGSPLAADAWFHVAIASNRLHDFETERDAYTRSLHLEWDRSHRSTTMTNRAETSMSLGNLREAREFYLTALDNTSGSDGDVYALAAWGLAVALARDDDLPDALKWASKAIEIRFPSFDPTKGLVSVLAIDLPNVFYTPEYEIFFYRALGEMASAERAGEESARRRALSLAVELWDQYLVLAKANGDRWVKNAEYQRRWCLRRLGDLRVTQPSEREGSTAGSGSRSRRPPPTRGPD
jgi:hypothetical protein